MCNVSGSPEDVKRKFGLLDQYAVEAGRDPKSVRRTIQVPLFLNDNPAFKERVLQGVAAMTGLPAEEGRKSILLGNVDEVKEQVDSSRRQAWKRCTSRSGRASSCRP